MVALRDGPTRAQSTTDHIALVMQSGRDRELLREWLESLPRYRVSVGTPETTLPGDESDLYILDKPSLERHRAALRKRQERAAPLFLPCLLIISDQAGYEPAEIERSGHRDRALINETISVPIKQTLLHRRIENLLHARRASVQLKEQRQQYEQLVDLTPEAILILQDGEIVYSNAAAVDVFGPNEETDLEGRSITTLVSAEDTSLLTDLLTKIERAEDSDQFRDVTMQSVTGDVVRAEIAGVRVTFDGEQASQLLIRDLTAEYERRQRLTLFGRAIQTAVQGITIADAQRADEPLIYVNDAFEEITGYSTAEILGRNCRFLQGEGTDDGTVARIRTAIEAEEPVSVEILNYRKDGTPFWNQLDIVPVRDDAGEVTHFLGLQRDITERKSRQERLQVLGRVLRHNLRNRLNVITGYASQLQDSDDPAAVTAASKITDASQMLLDLSEQIERFNSVISEPVEEFESQDVVPLLRTAADGFRSTYPGADVSLDLPDAAVVRAHGLLPAALEEVFELAVSPDEKAPAIEIAVERDLESTTIELVDAGRTIPRLELQVIEKATETPTQHPQGLELWLVRWVVWQSGGELSVTRDGLPKIRVRLPNADTSQK